MSNTLFIVRHGENPANVDRVFSNRHVDQGLTDKGFLQARQTAGYLRGLALDPALWIGGAAYTSPLKRAVDTADIIAAELGLKVVVKEAFREIDVGSLEDRPATAADWAFHQRIVGGWIAGRAGLRFPGGENYHEVWARIRTALLKLTEGYAGRQLLVVGHGGIFTYTLRDLCPDLDLEWLKASRWDNCGVTEIELQRDDHRLEGRLVAFSSSAHLHGAAADLIPGVPEEI